MQNQYLQEVTALIRKQQGQRGPVWMCGEQLLEMITPDEAAAKLVLDDLQHGGMSLKDCDAELCFAIAQMQLKNWLLEHEGGY